MPFAVLLLRLVEHVKKNKKPKERRMKKRLAEIFWFKFEKAEDFDSFVDLVMKNKCTRVEIAPMNSMMTGAFEQAFLNLNSVSTVYYVCCTAHTKGRKKVIYHHQHITRSVPHPKHAADHELHERKTLIEAAQCVMMLRNRSTVEVKLLSHKKRGVPLTVEHP